MPSTSTVPKILTQHTEELAVTWQRRQRAWAAPNHRAQHLQDIDAQIDAHLDGLHIAGRETLAPAMQRFKRWGTDEEALAATAVVGLCASHAADEATRAELDSLLIANPRSIRGAAAALFWIGEVRALPLLQRWWTSDQSVLWRAAFPACLPNPQARRPHLIDDALQRPDSALQARALRAIGEWRITERVERLPEFANGEDPLLREEAIYALRLLGYGERLPHCPAPTLLDRPSRRRWLGAFALTAPADSVHAAFDLLVSHSRERDALWLAIYRGDAWALSKLDAGGAGPATARPPDPLPRGVCPERRPARTVDAIGARQAA